MGKRIYRDFEVRGVVYPDANVAAAALGVTPEAVRIALRKGTAHRLGTGAVGAEPLPVRIRGRVFPSTNAAAAHLGVTPNAIQKALSEGREDQVGLPQRYNGAVSKPVTIGVQTYPSMASASRALGFSAGYVSQALRRQSTVAMQGILAAAMRDAGHQMEPSSE